MRVCSTCKTISDCQQRTSGTERSSPLFLKGGRKKYKRQKQKKEAVMELRPGKRVLKGEKFPNTTTESVVSLGSTEGNITGRKNK